MAKRERSMSIVLGIAAIVVGLAAASLRSPTSLAQPDDPRLTIAGMQDQLHELLQRRRQLLEGIAENEKQRLDYGQGSLLTYTQAKRNALLAGLDLCETQQQRLEIRWQVLRMYRDTMASLQQEVEAGTRTATALDEFRLARLEAEIDLLRERLQ